MTTKASENLSCPRCAFPVEKGFRFCPSCAFDQRKQYIPLSRYLKKSPIIIISAAAVFGLVQLTQGSKAKLGDAPVKTEQEMFANKQSGSPHGQDIQAVNASLTELRKKAEGDKDNKEVWKNLAYAQIELIRGSEKPSAAMIIDLISSLQEILRVDPKDQDALLAMADTSLNSKVPDKASEYYKRYLAERPEDIEVRARLGSSYALLNKYAEAETELKQVLSVDPKNFSALAYLAVAYAKQNKKDEAEKYANQARELVKSPEEKAEFGRMFQEMLGAPHPTSGNIETKSENTQNLTASAQAEKASSGEPIEDLIRKNPVAGSKFVKFERKDSAIRLVFKDFPMSAMPPFAKEKFFSGIRPLLKNGETLEFIDQASGTVMETIK